MASISVVIPTRNRKDSLIRTLFGLNSSDYPFHEVIVVDASEVPLGQSELAPFEKLAVKYVRSSPSVCAQRNKGVDLASGQWIFLCDDDIEVPANYVSILASHLKQNENIGAISGQFLQNENSQWVSNYPITSSLQLTINFIFQLSMWGDIKCDRKDFITDRLKKYYRKKGNHLSKAGWPVLTNFSGEYFETPVYSLGASLVKKEWLLKWPYDERLDKNGIGDNYGVAVSFPAPIRIVNHAFVYHHKDARNRLKEKQVYEKRILALHYFLKCKQPLKHVSKAYFIWSLVGLFIQNILGRRINQALLTLKIIFDIMIGNNPYLKRKNHKDAAFHGL